MRTFRYVSALSMTASTVLVAALLASSPVHAHVIWVDPMPRTNEDFLRQAPCGARPAGASVATYTAGTDIEVTVKLSILHTRNLLAFISYDNFATST